jgi:RecT family.
MTALVREDDNKKFYAQLRAVLGAEKASQETLETAIAYCQAAGLDPLRKPVAIISYGGRDQIVFTINAITAIAARSGWAGSDEIVYGPEIIHEGLSVPEWGYQVVYKIVQGHRCPFTGPRVYFRERYKAGGTWKNQPRTMLNKCVTAAALRLAFPEQLGHAYEEAEMKYEPVIQVDRSGVEAITSTPIVEELEEVKLDDIASMEQAIKESINQVELQAIGEAIKNYGDMSTADRKRLRETFAQKQKELG